MSFINTIVKTSDGITLVAGYHRDEIARAEAEGKTHVWFNSNDRVDIKIREGNVIFVGPMQEIVLRD